MKTPEEYRDELQQRAPEGVVVRDVRISASRKGWRDASVVAAKGDAKACKSDMSREKSYDDLVHRAFELALEALGDADVCECCGQEVT